MSQGFDRAALRLRGEKVLLHARDDAAAVEEGVVLKVQKQAR